MKEAFRENKLRGTSLQLVEQANEIVEQYEAQGLVLTLRQLYYQFVSRDLLANTVQNYKRLGSVISDARWCGLIDWNAIEDRGRVPSVPWDSGTLKSFADRIKGMGRAFKLNPWRDQDNYVELWVEKSRRWLACSNRWPSGTT